MTTTVVKSLGSGARDYSTIAAWVAAAPANLVTADQVWKGEMYNDSNSFVVAGAFSISGQTTDATRYMWLTAASGQSFADNANKLTNALRYNQSNGVGIESTGGFGADAFTIGSNYTRVERLQFKFNYVSHNNGMALSGTNCTVRESIVYRTSAYGNSLHLVDCGGASGLVVNVASIADETTSGTGFFTQDSTVTWINCTAISTAGSTKNAFQNQYNNPLLRNCAGFGYAGMGRVGIALGAGSDYNATDAGGSPNMGPSASHSLTGLTPSTEWTTTGGSYDPRPKAGNSLAVGTRDQTYTSDLDIIGQARSTSTPTIGAFEYVAGGGGAAALVGALADVATATGALTTGIAMQGALADVSTLAGTLTTGIPFAGSLADVATLTGAITTAIRLTGAAADVATLTGALTTGIPLAGALSGVVTLTGDINNAAVLLGAMASVSTLVGAMTTGIPLAGALASVVTASADLTASGGSGGVSIVGKKTRRRAKLKHIEHQKRIDKEYLEALKPTPPAPIAKERASPVVKAEASTNAAKPAPSVAKAPVVAQPIEVAEAPPTVADLVQSMKAMQAQMQQLQETLNRFDFENKYWARFATAMMQNTH